AGRVGLFQLRQRDRAGGPGRAAAADGEVLLLPPGEHRRGQYVRAVLPDALRGGEAARDGQGDLRPEPPAVSAGERTQPRGRRERRDGELRWPPGPLVVRRYKTAGRMSTELSEEVHGGYRQVCSARSQSPRGDLRELGSASRRPAVGGPKPVHGGI